MWDELAAVMTARHCKRAFLPHAVPRAVLERVLTAAAHAPSTRNSQPWRVAVVSGAARDALAGKLLEEFDRGVSPFADYRNRPPSTDPVIEERARLAGIGVLQALGINREDRAARQIHLRQNMDFYGAPVVMVFHLAADAVPGSFLELGFFLQNVMLGLVASGLGSCPQFSVAGYPHLLREELDLPGRLIVCTLAVGYPDSTAPVNTFAPERAGIADYVRWHDQAPPSFAPASAGVGVRASATCSQSRERTS